MTNLPTSYLPTVKHVASYINKLKYLDDKKEKEIVEKVSLELISIWSSANNKIPIVAVEVKVRNPLKDRKLHLSDRLAAAV